MVYLHKGPDKGNCFCELTLNGAVIEIAHGRLPRDADDEESSQMKLSDAGKAKKTLGRRVRALVARGYVLGHRNESLIKTIRADPSAVEPRVAYAEWLDSKGDPRARLIRTQLALAETPHDADLFTEERRLLSDPSLWLFRDSWHGKFRWFAGFVRSARFTYQMSRQEVRAALRHPSFDFVQDVEHSGVSLIENGIDTGSTERAKPPTWGAPRLPMIGPIIDIERPSDPPSHKAVGPDGDGDSWLSRWWRQLWKRK